MSTTPLFRFAELTKMSKLQLAGRIEKEWRKIAPRDPPPKAVAISNRLGDLEKGRAGWWDARERTAIRALEQAGRLRYAELPLPRDLLPSPDFPRLRPFNPGTEDPLALCTPEWFDPKWVNYRQWIIAPPGAGRSFVLHWHRVRGTASIKEVLHLADAGALFDERRPILLGVDAPDPDTDLSILARLDRREDVIVIAPFPMPRVSAGKDPRGASVQNVRWLEERWRPAEGWRPRLVRWLAGRVDDRESLLDAEQLIGWMDDVDPRHEMFATPGDVVPLCAFANDAGVPSFKRDVAERYLRQRVDREASDGTEQSVWLRAWAVDLVRALAVSRLAHVESPLQGPLSREAWASLAPTGTVSPAPSLQDVEAALDSVSAARGPREKKARKAEAMRIVQRRPSAEAIECLLPLRLLRPAGNGLIMHPHWVSTRFHRIRVRDEILRGDPHIWGRWAANADRRAFVDAELADVPEADLLRVIREAVAKFDVSDLGAVGAIEALFAEVGRRLGPGRRLADDLAPLWQLQRGLLTSRFTGLAGVAPLTRPGGGEGDGAWVACCWAWSLYGPRCEIDDGRAWLFPGWVAGGPTLGKLAPLAHQGLGEPGLPSEPHQDSRRPPGTLPRRSWSRWMHEGLAHVPPLPPAFDRLLGMAPDVVDACRDESVTTPPPAILLPAVLLAAHRRHPRWVLTHEQIDRIIGTAWGGAFIAQQVCQLTPDQRAAVVETLWTAAASAGGGAVAALGRLEMDARLAVLVEDNVPPERFAAELVPKDAEAVARVLDLPPRFRLPLVQYATEHQPGAAALAGIAVDLAFRGDERRVDAHVDGEDVRWIELLARDSRAPGGFQRIVWRLAPDLALAHAREAVEGREGESGWYFAAPESLHGTLLDSLEQPSVPLPSWAILWLRRRILEGGGLAERAHRLVLRSDVDGTADARAGEGHRLRKRSPQPK